MTRIDYYRINTSHYDGNLAAVKVVGRGPERRSSGFAFIIIHINTHTPLLKSTYPLPPSAFSGILFRFIVLPIHTKK